jgi:hypothetical protein
MAMVGRWVAEPISKSDENRLENRHEIGIYIAIVIMK